MQTPTFRPRFTGNRVQQSLLLLVLGLAFALCPARATSVIAPEFDELVSQADYIIRATVKSVTSEYRTTPQGKGIFTKVELNVLETISGTPPQPLVLLMLGGTVDGVTMRVEGVPAFHVGDEDILFVVANGTQFFPLVGIMNGKYPVKHDAMTGAAYVTRSNGAPLYDAKDVKQDLEANAAPAQHAGQLPLSPADFADKIRQSRSTSHAPAKPPSLAN